MFFSVNEQASTLSDQIEYSECETNLTDSELEYNKAYEVSSEGEVKETFLEKKGKGNAKSYVELVNTIGEA